MKWLSIKKSIVTIAGVVVLLTPVLVPAQSEPGKAAPPPIGQNLVREGTFALKLAERLDVITTDNEVEAESKLGEIGISPRNGWIADYPVTPDIIAELSAAISAAADADKLDLEAPEALTRFEQVKNEFSLAIRPYSNGEKAVEPPQADGPYPNPTIINNYYSQQGPPVVTYYAPPTDYYYLYSWVPYPFWGFGFWFPGFFILNDFHRVVHIHNRPVFISNHFNDIRRNRVFRIDPRSRFEGRTYAGIGAVRSRGVISTGVPRSEQRIFNSPRNVVPRSSTLSTAPSAGNRSFSSPPRSGSPAVRSGSPLGRGTSMGNAPGRSGGGSSSGRSGGGSRSGGGGGSRGGGSSPRMDRR